MRHDGNEENFKVVFVTTKVMNFEQITKYHHIHPPLGLLSLSPHRNCILKNVDSKLLTNPFYSVKEHIKSSYPDRGTCVPRPKYMRTPTEGHAYPDRGTMTLRYVSHYFKIRFSLLLSTNTSNKTNFSDTRATIFSVKCLR